MVVTFESKENFLRCFGVDFKPSIIETESYCHNGYGYRMNGRKFFTEKDVYERIEDRFEKSSKLAAKEDVPPSYLRLGTGDAAFQDYEPFYHLYPCAVNLSRFHTHNNPFGSYEEITTLTIEASIMSLYDGLFLKKCDPYFKYLKKKGITNKKEAHVMIEVYNCDLAGRKYFAHQILFAKLPRYFDEEKIKELALNLSQKIVNVENPITGLYHNKSINITGLCFNPKIYGVPTDENVRIFGESVVTPLEYIHFNEYSLFDLPIHKLTQDDKRLDTIDPSLKSLKYITPSILDTAIFNNKKQYLIGSVIISCLTAIFFVNFIIYGGIVSLSLTALSFFCSLTSSYFTYTA